MFDVKLGHIAALLLHRRDYITSTADRKQEKEMGFLCKFDLIWMHTGKEVGRLVVCD